MAGMRWINYDVNGKPIFFRADDGTGYNLDRRTNTWIRAGRVAGMTTEHAIEFVTMLKKEDRG